MTAPARKPCQCPCSCPLKTRRKDGICGACARGEHVLQEQPAETSQVHAEVESRTPAATETRMVRYGELTLMVTEEEAARYREEWGEPDDEVQEPLALPPGRRPNWGIGGIPAVLHELGYESVQKPAVPASGGEEEAPAPAGEETPPPPSDYADLFEAGEVPEGLRRFLPSPYAVGGEFGPLEPISRTRPSVPAIRPIAQKPRPKLIDEWRGLPLPWRRGIAFATPVMLLLGLWLGLPRGV